MLWFRFRLRFRLNKTFIIKYNHLINGYFWCIFGIGKEEWGGQCRYGRRQSPIDLARAAAVMGRYSSLYFQNYELQLKDAKIRNTGHSRKYIFVHCARFQSDANTMHLN